MAISIHTMSNCETQAYSWVWANSMALSDKFFLKSTWNVVDKATATTDRLVWVNTTVQTFASDNQTVAKALVEYTPATVPYLYTVDISGGTITIDDETKYFGITSAGNVVDGTTENISASGKQLQLVKFISATKWVFIII